MWEAANAAANGGTPAGVGDAADFYRQYARNGNLGMGALSGDPAALASFMNPFMSNVVDATKAQFGDLNAQTMKSTSDYLTKTGGLGGSRGALMQGAALAEANKGAQSTIANLLYGGYNDAMGRAGQAANFGMGAAGGLAGLSPMLDPAMRRLSILRESMGPSGQQYTQPVNQNKGAGFLGGAATLGGLAKTLGASSPWGWAAAGVGGLLGLLG